MFSQSAAQPNLNPNFCKNRDPLADFGKIDNLAQLRTYVLLQLGSPTICVAIFSVTISCNSFSSTSTVIFIFSFLLTQ